MTKKFPVGSISELGLVLDVPEHDLRGFAREADRLYKVRAKIKPSGRTRWIHAPRKDLKAVQRRLLRRVLTPLVDSPIAFGVKGTSQFDAARRHARRPWIATLDIESFFPSVSAHTVRSVLQNLGCGPGLLEVLVGLLTHRGNLVQGPPTSPAVANLLLADSDWRIHEEARRLRVEATRYVDDFAVSGETREAVRSLINFIEEELALLDLRLQPAKQFVRPRHERQRIHGLTVTQGLAVPKQSRNQLRSRVRQAQRYGCTSKERERLTGSIQHVSRLHRKEAAKLEAGLGSTPHARKGSAPPPRERLMKA